MHRDLRRAVHLTHKMARLREEHDALGAERGRLWYELNRGGPNLPKHTYREIAAACGVTETKLTKAIRREKEQRCPGTATAKTRRACP